MAYKELGNLQDTKELCEEILEEFQSIKISLGFLFEWRTATNETVYTQETLPSVVLDKDQVLTSEWEQSWDFVEQQLLDISEHNKVVSGLSLHRVCKVKSNWLAFQEFNTRNEEVRGVVNRTRSEPVQFHEQETSETELDMDYNSELFLHLLYFAYRLHRKQSLPKPGRVNRTAFREFVYAFNLEWLGNSVANLANVHLLCQRLQRINVVVYNARCNIVFENKKDNAIYTAILYWNGLKMLLIKNIETFLRRKRQQAVQTYTYRRNIVWYKRCNNWETRKTKRQERVVRFTYYVLRLGSYLPRQFQTNCLLLQFNCFNWDNNKY